MVGVGDTAFGGRVQEIADGLVMDFEGSRATLALASAPAALAAAPAAPPPPSEPGALTMERRELERRLPGDRAHPGRDRVVPVQNGSQVEGFAITRMPEGTLLTDAGLKAGDIVTEINGTPIDSLATLIGLWPRLQNETSVRAAVLRGGQPAERSGHPALAAASAWRSAPRAALPRSCAAAAAWLAPAPAPRPGASWATADQRAGRGDAAPAAAGAVRRQRRLPRRARRSTPTSGAPTTTPPRTRTTSWTWTPSGAPPFPEIPRDEAEHLRRNGEKAVEKGRVPWRVAELYRELVDAFRARDSRRALEAAATLGHYVADSHVPLHAVLNYDGQLTGQPGVHGRWESALVERFERQIMARVRPGPAARRRRPLVMTFEAC